MRVYADTDFFIALLKGSDWLKGGAVRLAEEHAGEITTSEATFIELMLLAKRYGLDHIRLTADVMAICGIEDTTFLKAARLISRHGMRVFDAFHAAHCGGTMISSDRVFDRVGLKRVRLERE